MGIQQWSELIWLVKLGDAASIEEDLSLVRDQAIEADFMPHVVIDFSEVQHVNSSHLSLLLQLRKLAIDRDARVKLAAMPDSIWAVFITTGLDKVFEFAEGVPTALAALQMNQ